MTDADLLARLHRNVMEVSALNGLLPDGVLERPNGAVLYSPAPDAAFFLNGVFREPGRGDAHALLERAQELFGDRGFVVYLHPDDPDLARAAKDARLIELVPHYPEMVCPAPLVLPAGDLRPVTTEEDAAAYWAVCDAAYPSVGMPEGTFVETFPPEMLLADGVEACLGYANNVAVACASVWMAEGIGMVGWVGTLPAARSRGLGAAVTVWATNRAFALGADVAALQASSMGEPIYQRLGYEQAYSYRIVGRPA
jgi:GNAT superfamily N-acetyltransferase